MPLNWLVESRCFLLVLCRPHPPIPMELLSNPPLQHSASSDCQNIQRHLQLRDGLADFWMYSDLRLERL